MLVVVVKDVGKWPALPRFLLLGSRGSIFNRPRKVPMTFVLTPKHNGKPMNYSEDLTGSQREAYERAIEIALALHKLLKRATFTVRVERTDRPDRKGHCYEVTHDGHTVD